MGSADEYAKRASELGQFALAQTDHGNLCGALEHIKACEKYGLHPIVGVEAYFRPNRLFHNALNKKAYHMVLLADGLRGWRSLMRLTSAAYKDDAYYYKPCIDYDLLERHSEGLIATTACVGGYLSKHLEYGIELSAHMEAMYKIFGDKFYVEIMPHAFEGQVFANPCLIEVANHYGLPVIATVDAHYVLEEHADTQDVVLMMSTQQTIEDRRAKREAGEEIYQFSDKTLYLMSEEEVMSEFAKNHKINPEIIRSAIANTEQLAASVNPFTLNKSLKLPRIRGKKQTEIVLRDWCQEGLNRIGENNNKEYIDRMEYELGVLKDKDVLDYFVIIGEIVRWAKQHDIVVGPGRGSAAGCLVSYLCNITAVDPIKYGLLFERFINPDRAGMPDIDVDFQSDRIDEVLEKFTERHGAEKVSRVISYQTFKAKGAIRDVARAFDVPKNEVDKVTERIDTEAIDEVLATSADLRAFADKYPDVMRHAKALEGSVKTFSQHAAAVIVTDKAVSEYMPIMKARKESPFVTAFSDKPSFPIISDYGYLKYDFLSLTDLTIRQNACRLIKERRGIDLDLDNLPVMRDPYAVDEKTMDLFRNGHTFGLFQFGGSAGITGMLRKMKPNSILDLAACNALYRPGPLDGGVAQDYINRIDNPHYVDYWHEKLKPYMRETYGIMIYQEQLMQVVQSIGGFTAGQADDMRKATGKLYRLGKAEARDFMRQYSKQWGNGCEANGIYSTQALEIWDKILAFGGYSFNKSHSVCYSVLAYQVAYLKANYPDEFYTALMIADPKKAPTAIREALAQGITILPPDINESNADMTLTDNGIRCGLTSVKGVGLACAEEIIAKRPFVSWADMNSKIVKQRAKANMLQALAALGAMDDFPETSLIVWDDPIEIRERELLGFSLTNNKIKAYNHILSALIKPDEIELAKDGDSVIIGGEITEIKWKNDKNGKLMCWLTIAYGAESWRVTVFSSIVPKYTEFLWEGMVVLARVFTNDRGMTLNFICDPEEYIKSTKGV